MTRYRAALAMALAFLSCPLNADSLRAMDFAFGQELAVEPGLPVQSLEIPDPVYRTVTQPGLADLRVFNAEGVPVAHAFCDLPAGKPPALETVELPAFQLRTVEAGHANDSALQVIGADGSRITVSRPVAERDAALESRVTGHVFDLRNVAGTVEAISPLWKAVEQDSEVAVRVQGSNDLQEWKTLVTSATLLRVQASDEVIERNRISLPKHQSRYLRFERLGGAPALEMDRALIDVRAPAPDRPQAITVDAIPQASSQDEVREERIEFNFFAEQRARFDGFVLALPEANMALEASLDSRGSPGTGWTRRWRGTVSTVGRTPSDEGRYFTDRVALPPRADRHWRLVIIRGQDSLAGRQPGLRLNFDQRTIRFLAQGQEPFTLVYGSALVRESPQDCSALMKAVASKEMRLGRASVVGSPTALGGATVLISEPQEKPAISVKTLLMWAALIGGAGAILFFALKLLRENRND